MKFSRIILFISLFVLPFVISAQYKEHAKKSFFFPRSIPEMEYHSQLNIFLAGLPEDYIEESSNFIYAPLFQYAAKLGYKHGLSFHGSLSTNIVTYNLQLGPRWAYQFNRFSLQLGYDVSFIYGKLTQFGFDNKVLLWMNYPSVSLGLALNRFIVCFKTEVNIITSAQQFTDNIEQSSDFDLYNGLTFSFLVEQPFWKDNYVTLGIKLNYLRLYYPVWIVFPTWDRFSFTPEFMMGLKF